MIRRPAPWSGRAARSYYSGAPLALVASGWCASAATCAFGGPFVLAAGAATVTSLVATTWAYVARRDPSLAPFGNDADWDVARATVGELRAAGSGGVTWDVWDGLSATSAAGDDASFYQLVNESCGLAHVSRREVQAGLTGERALELVRGVRAELEERDSS